PSAPRARGACARCTRRWASSSRDRVSTGPTAPRARTAPSSPALRRTAPTGRPRRTPRTPHRPPRTPPPVRPRTARPPPSRRPPAAPPRRARTAAPAPRWRPRPDSPRRTESSCPLLPAAGSCGRSPSPGPGRGRFPPRPAPPGPPLLPVSPHRRAGAPLFPARWPRAARETAARPFPERTGRPSAPSTAARPQGADPYRGRALRGPSLRGMPYRPALAVARHRGALGCACAALALAGALLVLRPAPEPVEQVLVAARDLSPRSPVGASDTAVRPIPRGAVPDGALPAESDPAGRSLTGPVRRGEVLTTARFADPPAADYGGGLVAVPVRI